MSSGSVLRSQTCLHTLERRFRRVFMPLSAVSDVCSHPPLSAASCRQVRLGPVPRRQRVRPRRPPRPVRPVCVCVCVCVCVRACARARPRPFGGGGGRELESEGWMEGWRNVACLRACACVRVCACARACVCVCALCVRKGGGRDARGALTDSEWMQIPRPFIDCVAPAAHTHNMIVNDNIITTPQT